MKHLQTALSSKERTLLAIKHQEADRVPIFFRGVAALGPLWQQRDEVIDKLLELGADAKVCIGLGPQIHSDVTIKDWFDNKSDPQYRLACREYDTPKGVLRGRMRCTPDCGYEDGVPLLSDHNVSRAVEFFVKGRADLLKLAYLLQEPGREEIQRFRERAQARRQFTAERGILLEGSPGGGGDLPFWLCGSELYYLLEDDPGFGPELLDLIYRAETKCLEIILEEKVDFASTRGVYQTAPIFSPQYFDRLFAPRLKTYVQLAHQAETPFSFMSSGDFVPHLDTLLALGLDVINCIRPTAQGMNNMRLLKKRIGRQICLWGGINPEEILEQGTEQDVRQAVRDAILAAAPGGGFVLGPGGSILDPKCLDNVLTFIRAAHEFGRYPLKTI